MPGILPMKVIKVGTSSQSRIAQACDRCRSKKIRCDGIRPTCTQCANVGFECRTSDKLSRRAFPRGYTESLEDRVRALEAEIRDLKDLLDEKDEKIEMLSKMHGHNAHQHHHHRRLSGNSAGSPHSPDTRKEASPSFKEDTFRVQASPLLLGVENSDSYFMGSSSGRAFIEQFKRKLQENGKACPNFNPESFLHIQGCPPLVTSTPIPPFRPPPRIFSDRCVNIYFQEWAPLFPVLHKPTFLHIYEEFVVDADKVKSNHKLAQLYLVFGIAALSTENPDLEMVAACEAQWQRALDRVLMENTIQTLQCLVLALMYCTARADYKRLLHYKGVAVALSHRLGLHQSQKRFSFGALTIETRKKVFWTLYTLDCFSAAMLGLPKVLKDDDVHAEYPSDCDDEYVTEKGFQPTLPGEYTKLSSALALFRVSRVLAKVLEKTYPATPSHDLSLQQLSGLDAELTEWSENLPHHLKLSFSQDKPSTHVTGSRSPILALAFYYIRTLIHRPAVGSSLGPKAIPSLLTIGESSKHIVQIVQLLHERNMSFSFCLNKTDVLVLCTMTLLYQTLDLKHDSKLLKDSERLANEVLEELLKSNATGTNELRHVASMLIKVNEVEQPAASRTTQARPANSVRTTSSPSTSTPYSSSSSNIGRHSFGSISEADLISQQERLRRMTLPNNGPHFYSVQSRSSFDSPRPEPSLAQRDQRLSFSQIEHSVRKLSSRQRSKAHLDYFSLSNTTSTPEPPEPRRLPAQPNARQQVQDQSPLIAPTKAQQKWAGSAAAGLSLTEWEALLGAMDGGQMNVYDAIYGGPGALPADASTAAYNEWSPESSWDMASFSLGDLASNPAAPQSVLSLSDDSGSNGDDVAATELYLGLGSEDLQNSMLQSKGLHNENRGGLIMDGLGLGLGFDTRI